MSAEALEHFRRLITESFTIVAVDVFNEVKNLVKSYEDENKRLRTLLNSVLQPEVRLPRIELAGPSLAVSIEGQGQTTGPPPPSASHDQVKDEQMECIISDDFTIMVKSEPEQPLISDTPSAVEFNCSTSSSVTVSAPASAHGDSEGSEGDEDEDGDMDQCNTEEGETSEKKTPPQKTLLESPRYKKPDSAFLPTPDEYREFISRLTEAYQDMPEEQRPLITRLGLNENIEFVDCALGRVPKGCPLSYQHPLPSERDFTPLEDAPPQPRLPLQSQKIDPYLNVPTLSVNAQAKLNNMKLTWEAAYTLEQATRKSKEISDVLKDVRLMNCFRDIFSLKQGQNNAEFLIAKIKRGKRRSKHATIEYDLKIEALREYCRLICVNWYPCGLVVHPGAPWLAAFPDGLVYDPNESITFGLLHVKCENYRSFIESKYLQCARGVLELKSNHPLYWHVQGEMMVTGTTWCDLLVYCGDDMLVQRVYRDEAGIKVMKNKIDDFFFHHFLPSLFNDVPLLHTVEENQELLNQSEDKTLGFQVLVKQ